MLFQVLLLVIILLITSYLATQGWLSATLLFVSAVFASILAGGLYEPAGSMFNAPNYGRGSAYLVIFLISFAALRFTGDIYIKGNVTLPVWVDRAGGAVVGLLTALVITGSLVIGACMMPLGESVAGWNRHPNGIRGETKALLPVLNPDGFVTWIYEMTLGRGMGGAYGGGYTFAQAHPNLGEELWAVRHKVQSTSAFSLPPELLNKPKAWKADIKGEEGYVVRMTVQKGVPEKSSSADKDHYFRATDSQIRLVAVNSDGEARQFFPVGYFEKGVTFIELGSGDGRYQYIQDDYTAPPVAQTGAVGEQAMFDLGFKVGAGFEPKFLEVKGARKEIDIAEARVKADASEYPPQQWKNELFRMSVDAHEATKVIPSLSIWVAPAVVSKSVVKSDLGEMAQKLEDNYKLAPSAIKSPNGQYLPTNNELNGPKQNTRDAYLGPDTEQSLDALVIPAYLWSSLDPTGAGTTNASRARDTLENKLKPILKPRSVPLSTNAKGSSESIQLAGGSYCIVAWFYDEKNTLYVWYQRIDAIARKNVKYTLATQKDPARKNTPEDVEITPNFIWPRP
jgi:hypothetical protein